MSTSLSRYSAKWEDFALIDSGNLEKVEQFGDIVMIRPEPQALWQPETSDHWKKADLSYRRHGREGEWIINRPVPEAWTITWEKGRTITDN